MIKDVVKVIRDDHRDVNHSFADVIDERKTKEKVNTIEKEIRTKENFFILIIMNKFYTFYCIFIF